DDVGGHHVSCGQHGSSFRALCAARLSRSRTPGEDTGMADRPALIQVKQTLSDVETYTIPSALINTLFTPPRHHRLPSRVV
ncbi:MAG: hypothetical protein ACE5Q3_12520, partial [Alphaproteobacteria bacterium]